MPQNQPWKMRVQELFQVCQEELKRTTEIGKKMLSASKTNTKLHDCYEQLGQLVISELEKGDLKWEHSEVIGLVEVIKKCEKDLEHFEGEVNTIKAETKVKADENEGKER